MGIISTVNANNRFGTEPVNPELQQVISGGVGYAHCHKTAVTNAANVTLDLQAACPNNQVLGFEIYSDQPLLFGKEGDVLTNVDQLASQPGQYLRANTYKGRLWSHKTLDVLAATVANCEVWVDVFYKANNGDY